MNVVLSFPAALAAEASPLPPHSASPLVVAANLLLADLEGGRAVDTEGFRAAMLAAFGKSDAEGAWSWKTAYEAPVRVKSAGFSQNHAIRSSAVEPDLL